MPTFEDVLGPGPLVQTPLNDLHSSLTMARDPTTGRRAFRLVHYPVQDAITDASVIAAEVFGYDEPGCENKQVCTKGTGPAFRVRFSLPPTTLADGSLVFEPFDHDAGAIGFLSAVCGCGTQDVRSVRLALTVRVTETPPIGGQTAHLTTFRMCTDCDADVRS